MPWFKNKIIILAEGTIRAGVDLDKLGEQDIAVDGDSVTMILPPPEVIGEPTLNLTETHALEGSTFNPFDPDWNKAFDAQRVAKNAMLEWALEHGLLDTARQNAEVQVELLLLRLGFATVEIKWQDE